MITTYISVFILFLFLVPLGYLLLLAIASIRPAPSLEKDRFVAKTRFLIVIPAHNEGNVIGSTVERLRAMHYPSHLYSIHVVADFCSDDTAAAARQAGAVVHERNQGERKGKGSALSWLFRRVLGKDQWDAVVIFDADTQVDPAFLQVVNARLAQGDGVIQGNHVISNSDQGWFPALTWAMFLIDNRFQNLGRSNLGWSAKNMGDSICFRSDVLSKIGWGSGLTEDYNLRQLLLLEGIKICYEPAAVGFGEAPLNWAQARAQRKRWLLGTRVSSQKCARLLLRKWLRSRDGALLDGALQAYLPSFSTLTAISTFSVFIQLLINWLIQPFFSLLHIGAWAAVSCVLFIYPFLGLILERAPFKAYQAVLIGPFFILWRTWLAFSAQFGPKQTTWVRTAHGKTK